MSSSSQPIVNEWWIRLVHQNEIKSTHTHSYVITIKISDKIPKEEIKRVKQVEIVQQWLPSHHLSYKLRINRFLTCLNPTKFQRQGSSPSRFKLPSFLLVWTCQKHSRNSKPHFLDSRKLPKYGTRELV